MLDLSFADRVKVDNAYDDLLDSVGFREYRQPASGIEAFHDAAILRLYELDGTLVDERLGKPPAIGGHIATKVTRVKDRLQPHMRQVVWTGSPSSSFHYSAQPVSNDDVWLRYNDRDSFSLVDQFRPAFFDTPTPALFPHAEPFRQDFVALCLVYLPTPTNNGVQFGGGGSGTSDMKNYMLQNLYAGRVSYDLTSDPYGFFKTSSA